MINGSIFHLPLASQSVHCIVFSPPYYSLRDYGLDPIIIGGQLDCVHEWSSEQSLKGKSNWDTFDDYRAEWDKPHGGQGKMHAGKSGTHGSFCLNCNAWRGGLGLEPTPELFIEHCRIYARECWRVLRDDGVMWVNIGASYAGSGKGSGSEQTGKQATNTGTYNLSRAPVLNNYKPKDLIPTPWLFAIALQQDGWYLRSDIIWAKSNPMPSSARDRPTTAHEYVFLFSKSRRYFYDADVVKEKMTTPPEAIIARVKAAKKAKAKGSNDVDKLERWSISEPYVPSGRNLRSVWTIPTHGFSEAHFATFPPKLIEPMIKAGTSEGGVCVECGSQFERVVNTNLVPTHKAAKTFVIDSRDTAGNNSNDQGSNRQRDGHKPGWINQNHTLGFRPTCDHYIPLYYKYFPMARSKRKRYQQFKTGHWLKRVRKRPVPDSWRTDKAIILDPFGGAGTTELVATQLGRQGVSVELSFDYCTMAVKRLKSGGKRVPRKLVKLIKQGQRQMFDMHRIEVEGDDLETLDEMKIEQLGIFEEK